MKTKNNLDLIFKKLNNASVKQSTATAPKIDVVSCIPKYINNKISFTIVRIPIE